MKYSNKIMCKINANVIKFTLTHSGGALATGWIGKNAISAGDAVSQYASLSSHESHSKSFLKGLKDRGMNCVELVISDDHEGLGAGGRAVLGSVPWLEENQSEGFTFFDFLLENRRSIRTTNSLSVWNKSLI